MTSKEASSLLRSSDLFVLCKKGRRSQILVSHFLDFWKIPYHLDGKETQQGIAILLYDKLPEPEQRRVLVIPSETPDFLEMLKARGVVMRRERGATVRFNVTEKARMILQPDTLYSFSGSDVHTCLSFDGQPAIQRLDNFYLLTLDVLREFNTTLESRLNAPTPKWLRAYTKLPFSYSVVPRRIRNYFMKGSVGSLGDPANYEDACPLDALRYFFLMCLASLAERAIPIISFWRKGKTYVYCSTHDVESREGLRRAQRLISVERKHGVRSCWYVPTDRYPLVDRVLDTLHEGESELGAHDSKHDGKLYYLNKEQLKRRFLQCREELQRLTASKIEGFRAPLLQYSWRMLDSLSLSNFSYDSSCPTWEPLAPSTISPFLKRTGTSRPKGVGTVFPLVFPRIVEVPLTLPQDYHLIHVAGRSQADCVRTWMRIQAWIKQIGGICSFLVHPDYRFADLDALGNYEEWIRALSNDPQGWNMLPREIAQWWNMRSSARIVTNGEDLVIENVPRNKRAMLEICLARHKNKGMSITPWS